MSNGSSELRPKVEEQSEHLVSRTMRSYKVAFIKSRVNTGSSRFRTIEDMIIIRSRMISYFT